MRYWDTSALVPLFVSEDSSSQMRALYRADPAVLTWWGTRVECASVLARRHRNKEFTLEEWRLTQGRLGRLRSRWQELGASSELRTRAEMLVGQHFLRAADALQLSAALVAKQRANFDLAFVTRDDRLRAAALEEGFTVLP